MRPLSLRIVALLVAAALIACCSPSSTIFAPPIGGDHAAYVVTSDFMTGSLSVIDLETRRVTPNVAAVYSDATLRVYGGLIYVINRFGQDNIQVIDPDKRFFTRLQFSTGNGSNPQDIAFLSPSKAYVSRYGSDSLLVVDPRNGAQRKLISLAQFADVDGLPEMAQMALVEPWLFVACQRLTNFTASVPGVIAVIDTRTDELVDVAPTVPGIQGITLTGRNPFTDLVHDPATRELLVGCVGSYGVADGGIERIDIGTRQSLGFAISETTLGGDILDLAWNGAGHSYAVVSDASFNTSLVGWSAATGAVLDTVYAPGGFSLADCAINDRGELYVCDNRFAASGVVVFRVGADTLLAGPLNTGLPPNQVAFR